LGKMSIFTIQYNTIQLSIPISRLNKNKSWTRAC